MIIDEIIHQPQNNLQKLLDFMIAIKNNDKSADIRSKTQVIKTSHNLEIVSSNIEFGWLVHFTNAPNDILSSGIEGVRDYRLLGQTRGLSNKGRGIDGFNYAFPIPSKEASYEQSRRETSGMSPYGQHALIFQAHYIRVYHKGDRQIQAIFLSPELNPAQCTHLSSVQNLLQLRARAKLQTYNNQPVFINGKPVEPKLILTPDEVRELYRVSNLPSILWKIENGPLVGTSGGWAKIVKQITKAKQS